MSAALDLARRRDGSLQRPWRRLAAWVPVRRREFWGTQALVLLIAGSHGAVGLFFPHELMDPIRFVPVSLFIVPVVYAALNFGLAGSMPTALWCFVLTLPNALLWHPGTDWIAEIWQAGMVVAVGMLVGQRIDRERRSRAEADQRELARRASEEKYRRLFDRTTDAILLLDQSGAIEEANDAAARLFRQDVAALRGRRVGDLADGALGPLVAGNTGTVPIAVRSDDRTTWINPVITVIPGSSGPERLMAVLHDITLQVERQGSFEYLARQTMSAREEERRRAARDLHDGPLQNLVILCRKLDGLALVAAPPADRQLLDARHLAEAIADELRRFSRDLRPSVLDDLGLGAALRSEVAAFSRRTGIASSYLEHGDAERLPGESELMLLRIAQEALHNVERHAAAGRLHVHLAFRPHGAVLTVADDGMGFDADGDAVQLLVRGKLGVVGMQERALLAGGQLTVRSGRGRGTVVRATIPTGTAAAD